MTSSKPTQRGERIAKYLARAGVGSRREVEAMIAAGRITADGKPVRTPAFFVTAGQHFAVDGKSVDKPQPTRLWRYHKRRGVVTTENDPEKRQTVFDTLPAHLPRVIKIGRLDINSEGLLLLTNDGHLARHLELPATGWKRSYRARVHGKPDAAALAALANGIEIEGMRYGPIEATVEHQHASNAWLAIALREGKNREVRRVLAHLGLPVNRLIRESYGPFQLGALGPGKIEEVPPKTAREHLGAFISSARGARA